MLRKVTREHAVDADMRAVLAAGVSRERMEDALAVCFTFNTVDRLSRTFEYFVPSPKAYEAGAKFLLARGSGDHGKLRACRRSVLPPNAALTGAERTSEQSSNSMDRDRSSLSSGSRKTHGGRTRCQHEANTSFVRLERHPHARLCGPAP